jgi:hypothetical protein
LTELACIGLHDIFSDISGSGSHSSSDSALVTHDREVEATNRR